MYNGRWDLPESKWHNPFSVKSCGSAEEAVRRYEAYIRKQPKLLSALHELDGKVLGCWCKSNPSDIAQVCHGDVLVKLINEFSRKE